MSKKCMNQKAIYVIRIGKFGETVSDGIARGVSFVLQKNQNSDCRCMCEQQFIAIIFTCISFKSNFTISFPLFMVSFLMIYLFNGITH